MIRSGRFSPVFFFSALLSLTAATTATAQQPGITDTEIRFGNIMPYSGPASGLSVVGKAFTAYFDLVNENGGVNGGKLNMISLDDGFSPPKTVEATRRLVENDGVAFMFGNMGTAPSSANAHETGWRPMRLISSGCANKETVMVPAGLEAANGIMSVGALKPYTAESKDPDMVACREFMKARVPNVDPANFAAGYGYMVAQAPVVVLAQCKNNLSRENIMAQAANLKDVSLPLLMPG